MSGDDPRCDQCQDSPIQFICPKCEENLCNSCDEKRHTSLKFKEHKRYSNSGEKPFSDRCSVLSHSQIPLTLFCQTCTLPVCPICVTDLHKDHIFTSLTSAVEIVITQFMETIDPLKEWIGELEKEIKNKKIELKDKEETLVRAEIVLNETCSVVTKRESEPLLFFKSIKDLKSNLLQLSTPATIVLSSTSTLPFAQTLLHLAHSYRKDLNHNYQDALRFYKLAAAAGNDEAEAWVAFLYLRERSEMKTNYTEAFRLSKVGVGKDQPLAYRNLGICYCYGQGVEKDLKEGIRLLRRGVELGNSSAQVSLGTCYMNGIGVTKDTKEAIRLYRLAVEQGDADAKYNLATLSERYWSNERQKESVRLYRLAAEQGNSYGQFSLGTCYYRGTGVEKDEKEAVRWYRLAAVQGHAFAQYNLGFCYSNGFGIEKNEKEAVGWYRLSAERGLADAQCELGICYEKGIVVEQDMKEAIRLYRLASEQGHPVAQYNLGVCYEYGRGVEVNVNESLRLYQLAAATSPQGGEAKQMTNLANNNSRSKKRKR